MTQKSHKDPLNEDQRFSLNQLHIGQLSLEVTLGIFILTILTINISSVIPGYGIVDIIVMGLSGLMLFIFGIVVTVETFHLKRVGNPLARRAVPAKRWLSITWVFALLIPVILLFSPFQEQGFQAGRLIILFLTLCGLLIAITGVLVALHFLWRRFNKKKRFPVRPLVYGAIGLSLLLLFLLGSYTTTEVVAHGSVTTTDAHLELGQSEVRQAGKDGEKQTKHNLIFGFATSTTTSDAIDQITAQGSRRYQYMYCSNGSYVYYTAEQFKDPTVGFTHQSPDDCAAKGHGAQTTIADVPPPEKVVQQVPVYRSPSSYTTTCNTYGYYSTSITCHTY